MSDDLTGLSNRDLQSLVAALRSGRLAAPYSSLQVMRVVPTSLADSIRPSLISLADQSFSEKQVAAALELILADRKQKPPAEPPIDLVTSGPEAPGVTNRDTSVVVRELFTHSQNSVLVIGYAVYQGQQVFEALAKRMEDEPGLDVQLFLNVSRPDRDTTNSEILLSRFQHRFKETQWPAGHRIPEVYYDPRSIADNQPVRSSLHAKCVVVDARKVFVSSANFTEAGQERNIEVGLTIESEWLAQRIVTHFKLLHDHGLIMRAF